MSDNVDFLGIRERAAEKALGLIRDRFEGGTVPNHMHYHNRVHTQGVIDKSLQIGAALGLDERQMMITGIAAAFHDTVQEWTSVTKDNGAVNRVRFAGANEIASAKEAMDCVAELGAPLNPEEKGLIGAAILATIPGWGVPYSTVIQPFLKPDSHKIVRAVALADLGSSGMDPDMFLTDGPTLFAEENLDVTGALEKASSPDEIDEATQESYRARYIGWLKIQPGFARGRQRYFADVESASLEGEDKDRLQALFSRYDESIAAAEAAVARAEAADFVTLMRQLDPKAFGGSAGATARPPLTA
jgi:sorbitol-specific phosphotransferase system component IIA